MLQQTTVAVVIPYFERFLKSFPTVRNLASADVAQVLKLWEGLGYYRRARHLHEAAVLIVEKHGGEFPRTAKLPGVGRYIRNAILSQAYDERLPIVEANSLRVLTRYFGYRGDPRKGEGQRWVWKAAESLLPRSRVGDFNQALMELGSIVCTPKSPRCDECPLKRSCMAHRDGLQHLIPQPKKITAVISVVEVAIVIRRGDRVLLARRPASARRWAGMWEFPHSEVMQGESLSDAAIRIARELTNLRIQVGSQFTCVNHTVTRFAIRLNAFEATTRTRTASSAFYQEFRWCLPREIGEFPMSTPQRKLLLLRQTMPLL